MQQQRQKFLVYQQNQFTTHSLCLYCQREHPSDSSDKRCPLLQQASNQRRDSRVCPTCRGAGTFRVETVKVIAEPIWGYEKRVKQWKEAHIDSDQIDVDQYPEQNFQQVRSTMTNMRCRACNRGHLLKFVNCQRCEDGLSCSSSTCRSGKRISRRWVRAKFDLDIDKRGIQSWIDLTSDQCSICGRLIQHKSISFGCQHLYHQRCLPSLVRKCPECTKYEICKREQTELWQQIKGQRQGRRGSERNLSLSWCSSSNSH